MKNATALFCADVATPDAILWRAAEAAAADNIHLAVLLYSEVPTPPLNAYGAMPYGSIAIPDSWPVALEDAQKEVRDRMNAIEGLIAKEGASADVRPLFVSPSDIRSGVALSTRTSDIAFFAPNLRDDEVAFKEMLHAVLFHSPIAAKINGSIDANHDCVLLAWNNSLSSARAAHLALPYLKAASNVHIVCFDVPTSQGDNQIEPGREAAAWLSHQGCTVALTQLPSGGREIGTCILDHATEIGADLVVSGAYGHSRLQQAVFGGTSRTLIEQTEMAILMAH